MAWFWFMEWLILVYKINRIIHGRLEIWNLSSHVHIRYLTRLLCSLVRYRCEHSKINSISPRVHALFSIYSFINMGHYFVVFEAPGMHEYFSPTVAHNCHIKTKCLQQITNRSNQIQIAHSKFKSLTANYKSHTENYISLTANSNHPQQIQIVHSKLMSLTANANCSQQITNY